MGYATKYFEAMGRRDWSMGRLVMPQYRKMVEQNLPDWACKAYLRGHQAQIPYKAQLAKELENESR